MKAGWTSDCVRDVLETWLVLLTVDPAPARCDDTLCPSQGMYASWLQANGTANNEGGARGAGTGGSTLEANCPSSQSRWGSGVQDCS